MSGMIGAFILVSYRNDHSLQLYGSGLTNRNKQQQNRNEYGR